MIVAGIGFELKKLFKDKGLLSTIRAYLYSTFVTVGPIIISVLVITTLQFLLKYAGIKTNRRELLQVTIMYAFIFSVIISSGYCMMLSRYLSDRLYEEKEEDILPALYGSLATIIVICGIIGIIFYYRSPIDHVYNVFSYMLFVGLTVEMVLGVYVTAIKEFKKVAFGFLYGTILGLITGYTLAKYKGVDELLSVVIGFDLCILVVIIILANEIQKYFRGKSSLYFNFIKYFEKFHLIFFTNLFFTMGLYVHNFAFWMMPEINRIIEGTYVYAPLYDIPGAYAFLSCIPTMIMFVVKVETGFYEKYKNYFALINSGGAYEDIEVAKKQMIRAVYKEVLYIMKIQLIFSIGFLILGIRLLPLIGFTSNMINIYSLLVLGYYCVIIMFVIMTILLYYDHKKAACLVTLSFVITSFVFTLITAYIGTNSYGLGFFLSGMLSLIYGIRELEIYFNDIEYHVFCIQTGFREDDEGKLSDLIDRMNKIGG